MPVPVELATSNRAVGGLRPAGTSLRDRYGEVPTVIRLRNDLERLGPDVHRRPPAAADWPGRDPIEMHQLTDELHDASMCADRQGCPR